MNKSIFNEEIENQIKNGNYTFFTLKGFFGFDDFIRFIKMFYIFVSFILNLIMIISLKKGKLRKSINPIAFQLISNILVISFIHSLSYMINWITNLDSAYTFEDNNNKYKIGGLLIGSPRRNFLVCKLQGFMILFSSLCQDIFINIFFYIINKENIPKKKIIVLIYSLIGYICPFVFSIIYAIVGGLGLNDRYCYIKKFEFNKDNEEKYSFVTTFKPLIIILYSIRGINLIISFILLFKIIKYVKKNNLSKLYILKSSSILLIQIVSFSISFLYRISRIIFSDFNKTISDIHLCINTLDSILFPLSFSLSNGIYTNLCYNNLNDSSNSLSDGPGEIISSSAISSSIYSSSNKNEKSLPMVDLKNNNNFDLSYM